MKAGFALRLAIREGRHSLRRVGVDMASISLGVGALVSIHSFRDDVARSVQQEADALMGANARLAGSEAQLRKAVRHPMSLLTVHLPTVLSRSAINRSKWFCASLPVGISPTSSANCRSVRFAW